LGEVADKIAMGPFGSNIKVETFKDSGIPIISGMHLHGIRLIDSDYNFISQDHADRLINSNVYRHDVIFTHAGTIGQVSYIPDTSKYERYIISQRQFYLRCNPEKLDYKYITYFFKSPYGQYLIDSNTNQTGVPSIAQPVSFLKNVDILLPPLPEQQAIAAVLSSLDDKIDLLHRQNKTLEALAETLFRQWFVEPCKDGLPEGWREGKVSDLIYFNPNRILRKGAVAPYLAMASLSTTTFMPTEWREREFSSGMKFINGDTLLARITPCLENGKAAFITFLKETETGWGSTEYIVMRPKEPIHPFFAYTLAKNSDFRDYAEGCLEGTSGRQRVNIDHLMKYPIIIPDQHTIDTFNSIAEVIVPKLDCNAKQIRILEKLRDTLLPKLMSGEVRVEV
jgi:type I restriction enzyme S subunit